jgi:hypothetical protein
MAKSTIIFYLKWTSRVWGSLVLVFILIFFFAHLFDDPTGQQASLTNLDILAILCFPIGLIAGLILAYWRPLMGGLIALLSLVVLCSLRPDLLQSVWIMVAFAPSSILYILYGIVGARPANDELEEKEIY